MDSTTYDQARNMALMLLRPHQQPTREQITAFVAVAFSALRDAGRSSLTDDDRARLEREIQTMLNVWAPDGTQLDDPTGHEPWLPDRRSQINPDFWRRYERYLEEVEGIPLPVVARLDGLTHRILELLEDPKRPGVWDRRGMVVGQVQSGKTSNYTGLICKAVDAGYKLIVVLAGVHNSLRSQTQLRLDEGFLGRDTQQSRVFTQQSPRLGVGHIVVTDRPLIAHSLTTSAGDGDFHRTKARSMATYIGGDPVILVVKKNGPVLANLIKWVQATRGVVVQGVPLLVVDDEADHASVDTRARQLDEAGKFVDEHDPTAINRRIRELLNTFEQSAYVGYTATPFANIFIPPDGTTVKHGEDLFPRSFIINLPAPSNYFGPVQLFGLAEPGQSPGTPGLPVVRQADDAESIIPSVHRSHLVPTDLPKSLKEAVKAFILSCAARLSRGQDTAHNSMLIHVTRFKAVQRRVHDLVQQELRGLQQRLEYGDGDRTPTLMSELRVLWQQDFEPTTLAVRDQVDDPELSPLTWAAVQPHLKAAAVKIRMKLINGEAQDVLDYHDHPNGLSVIAIGGDKLSRGLTLEGLTVSYYLRASRMYDTLMQMGRWFGYRRGYLDLCRLYTTSELVGWYEHITAASEELRQEFDRMASAHMTPTDYGLKVQTHPGGLTVTSAGKMRYGQKVRVSFHQSLIESYLLRKDKAVIDHNYRTTDSFLRSLPPPTRPRGTSYHWKHVPAAEVAAFLSHLNGHPAIPTADPAHLSEYITTKAAHGELVDWTVVLIDVSTRKASTPGEVAGLTIGLPLRSPGERTDAETYHIRNRHIIAQEDEALDLSDDERARALEATIKEWELTQRNPEPPKRPSGPHIRAQRPRSRGLLLIYALDPTAESDTANNPYARRLFEADDERRSGPPIIGYALSFPGTDRPDEAVEYLVNTVYMREEFGDE